MKSHERKERIEMMKIVKGGLCVSFIYLLAVVCTLLVTQRVQQLDSNNDFRNTNSSLSIYLTR